MPFDGTDQGRKPAAIRKIDEMIAFYSVDYPTWATNTFYCGQRYNPKALCLRGAVNYFVCSDPVVKFPSLRKDGSLWREIHNGMRATAKRYYNTRSYIKVNDRYLANRADVIRFLRRTQDHLHQAQA